MLLIGDIHANARHINAILDNLKKFVEQFSNEKNIVFLGDYMYMFSYDRQALGDLFDFFLELRGQGKNVYILTGNHDWLNQHFVYHEGKKVSDILNKQAINKLYFITEPETHTIEDKEILFMPYNKAFLGQYMNTMRHPDTEHSEVEGSRQTTTHSRDSSAITSEGRATIKSDIIHLLESKNYNEQLSRALNDYLLSNYKPGMVLMHHYYTTNISFPGQQAKFDYKDISLHPMWTSYADKIISGHLHKAFIHENYICVGSVWSTTSGERNQSKFLWQRDATKESLHAQEIAINPYISIESATNLTLDSIASQIDTLKKDHISLLPEVKIETKLYEMEKISLILYSPDSVKDIEQLINADVKAKIGDIQLKHTSSGHKDMTELLDISQYNVQQSLLDWKELVKKYLMSRYGPESEKYRTLLSELNIL